MSLIGRVAGDGIKYFYLSKAPRAPNKYMT